MNTRVCLAEMLGLGSGGFHPKPRSDLFQYTPCSHHRVSSQFCIFQNVYKNLISPNLCSTVLKFKIQLSASNEYHPLTLCTFYYIQNYLSLVTWKCLSLPPNEHIAPFECMSVLRGDEFEWAPGVGGGPGGPGVLWAMGSQRMEYDWATELNCVYENINMTWSIFSSSFLFALFFWRTSGEGNDYPFQYSCLGISWTDESGKLESMGSLRMGQTEWLKLFLPLVFFSVTETSINFS